MNRYFLVSLIAVFAVISSVYSQDTIVSPLKIFSHVPRQFSIEGGYRNVFYQKDNSNVIPDNTVTHGYGFLADYAWQLSGLDGRRAAAYISVPIGYTVMMPDNNSSKGLRMLNYGWTVRHELTRKTAQLIPFVGYGLFLNNLSIDGLSGSCTGHQTQFEFGVTVPTRHKAQYFMKLQASYTSYPRVNEPKSMHLMFADLRMGIRF